MYWKMFTRSGKTITRREHLKENIKEWCVIMDKNEYWKPFTFVYSDNGRCLGRFLHIKPYD